MKMKKDLSMSATPNNSQNSSVTRAFVNKPINTLHTFYLSGNVEESSEYISWFEIMRNAGEHDIIQIHINSYGGDLFCAIQFLRAIADTQAHVICSVEGACMSAATMIFLTADSFEVSEHSMFMFHNYSSMTFGKGGEMYDNIMHERKWSEHLLRRIYDKFLTESEIQSLLANKDIWMDGDEVLKRLESRAKLFEKEHKALQAKTRGQKPTAAKPRKPKAAAILPPTKKPAPKK